eukprot:13007158-Ditylum_brightwellii.AAC.1
MLLGGGQEYGIRAGMENVPNIVGLGTAADLLMQQITLEEEEEEEEVVPQWQKSAKHMYTLKSRLYSNLVEALGSGIV